jgi:hypothetical protein
VLPVWSMGQIIRNCIDSPHSAKLQHDAVLTVNFVAAKPLVCSYSPSEKRQLMGYSPR